MENTALVVAATAIITAGVSGIVNKFLKKHNMDDYLLIKEFERRCGERQELCPAKNSLETDIREIKADIRELRQDIKQIIMK